MQRQLLEVLGMVGSEEGKGGRKMELGEIGRENGRGE